MKQYGVVRLSVPLAPCTSVRRVCCRGPGGQEISIDSGGSTALSNKCEQCHADSVSRQPNTVLHTSFSTPRTTTTTIPV